MYSLVLSFLYVYVSRNKKNEELQNGSVIKLAKSKEEIKQSRDAQCFHNAAERQGGQHYRSDQFMAREVMSRKWASKMGRCKRGDVERMMQKEGMLFGEREITWWSIKLERKERYDEVKLDLMR